MDPNSTNEDHGPAVLAVTAATLVLSTVFVVARVICRIGIVRHTTWDDYIILLAWFLAFGLTLAIDLGTRFGLGQHDANIPAEDRSSLRGCEYAFSILYNPALMATKSSILIFYLRLSKNTQKVLRLASWAVLAIVNVAGTVLTLMNIFQCSPIRAAFDASITQVQCIPLLTEFICSAPVNIVTDLAILALPLPVLTGMRLPYRQKVILIMTFALGIFVTVVDVVRVYYLQQAISIVAPGNTSDPSSTFGGEAEFAFNASPSMMWSAVEVNVGLVCACIPTLKPLIIRILPAMLVDPNGTRDHTYSKDKVEASQQSSRHLSTDARAAGLGAVRETSPMPPTPPPPAHAPEAHELTAPDHEISALEFITAPEMATGPSSHRPEPMVPLERIPSGQTVATAATTEINVYFGFVNMKRPKSLIRTPVAESWVYCSVVSILFCLWGVSYGLLNILNNAIADVVNMTEAQTIGLTSIYFGGGYFLGPLLIGEWVLRHDEHHRLGKRQDGLPSIGGFKATFIVGLSIYGVGTIMFWPSAVLTSFAGFMISTFVVGFGLAVLETGANSFIALCGPMDYAEMRLLLAQGLQAVATVVSGVLAQKVFFVELESEGTVDSSTLIDVQWTYLAVTLFCVALALFFYYMPLPEVTDAEMEHSTRYLPVDPKKRSFFGFQLRTWTLTLAVLAQWTYVAGQESMSIYFHDLIVVAIPKAEQPLDWPSEMALSTSDYLLIAHSAFAISRFLVAFLSYLSPRHSSVPQPRTVLNVSTAMSIVLGIVISVRRSSNPNTMVIPTILFYFSEGPMWPLIYTQGLRGQGKRTKRAAAYITMGASGPMFWPFVMYAIINRGGSPQTAFIIVPSLLTLAALFALFLDLKQDARLLVDSRVGAEEQSKIQDRANREVDLNEIMITRRRSSAPSVPASERESFVRRMSNAFGKGARRRSSAPSEPAGEQETFVRRMSNAFGKGARRKASTTPPDTEHQEIQDNTNT